MGKFVIYEVATGHRFNLVANNNEVIGVSEVYNSLSACQNGIKSVQKNAPIANVEDQTKDEKAANPKFEIFSDKAGEFRFRLKAKNGEIILASEGYTVKASAKNGIASVVKNAPGAQIVQK